MKGLESHVRGPGPRAIRERRRNSEMDMLMDDIRSYGMISREEERWLCFLVRNHAADDDVRAAARHRLVLANMPAVIHWARLLSRTWPGELIDLVSVGVDGLITAIDRYDQFHEGPDGGRNGATLASYAAWWIRSKIARYKILNRSIIKTTQREHYWAVKYEQFSMSMSPDEAARKAGVPKKCRHLLEAAVKFRTMSRVASGSPSHGKDGAVQYVLKEVPDVATLPPPGASDLWDEVEEFIRGLGDRERSILEYTYGLGPTGVTMKDADIGALLGMCSKNVSMTRGRIRDKIAKHVRGLEERYHGVEYT